MNTEFLQRANDIELKLEAEGLHLTAEAMRQVIDTYIWNETNGVSQMNAPKVSKPHHRLT